MRQILLTTTVLLSLFMFSCKTNSLNGVYVCDQSIKKEDSTIHHKNYTEDFLNLTCIITELEFKGNSTVAIKMANGEIFSSYIIDKEYVRIKGTGSDILLKIQDQKTISGEGITQGIYHKK